MSKVLLRPPRWGRSLVAVLGAVATFVVAPILAEMGVWGWPLYLDLGGGAVLLFVSYVLAEVDRAQENREKRLHVEVQPAEVAIRPYGGDDGTVQAWRDEEENRCLEPLRKRSKRQGLDQDGFGDDESDPARDLTGQELEDIERREADGEELTEQEKKALAAGTAMAEVASKLTRGLPWVTGEPESRSPETYKSEVRRYLDEYQRWIEAWARRRHAKMHGRLDLTLVNPGDRPYDKVQVTIHLPKEVEAVDLDAEPPDEPQRPRAMFGERRPKLDLLGSSRDPAFTPVLPVRPGPSIDTASDGSTRITFPAVNLRATEHKELDPLHLVVTAGPVIEGKWEATSTSAEGRSARPIRVRVADEHVTTRELLTDEPDNDEGGRR